MSDNGLESCRVDGVSFNIERPDGSVIEKSLDSIETIKQLKEEVLDEWPRIHDTSVYPLFFMCQRRDDGTEIILQDNLIIRNSNMIKGEITLVIKREGTPVNSVASKLDDKRQGSLPRPQSIQAGPQVTLPVSQNNLPAGQVQSDSTVRERVADLATLSCTKNPGHTTFIPVLQLTPDQLPEGFQSRQLAEVIRLKGEETVRLTVRWTSPNRPHKLGFHKLKETTHVRLSSGTAFVMDMRNKRPCYDRNCQYGTRPHEVSGVFKVMTAAHVVFDDKEAQNTTIDFFLDDERTSDAVVKAHGVRISSVDVENNRSILECVTHDLGLHKKLQHFRSRKDQLLTELATISQQRGDGDAMSGDNSFLVVHISHPHGAVKQVTFGELLTVKSIGQSVKVNDLSLISCSFTYTASTCPGSGGGAVNVFTSSGKCVGFAPHYGIPDKTNNTSGLGWVNTNYIST